MKTSLPDADTFQARAPACAALPFSDYGRDACERAVLFLDTLRRRGNNYVEHLNAGEPALLKFGHERVLDGRSLPEPCNYALLQITPPAGFAPDPRARPVVVVDPRAGHGPGIGGFKADSEVGVAMRAGHPVYFVTFRPEPEEGQTLLEVARAEAQFLETVAARHPQCPTRPLVIGNCQAGWAMAGLAAVRPELFGPLLLVGSPLSYWAGGSRLNPMRYSGALLGGAWLAALSADLGADRFDGACLVENFEKLNPANSLWGRYYRLWSQVDSEAERFLEFERWWGGYFRMSGAEIESIVENLFVGNRLARGEVRIGGHRIDLRRITAPVIVFASWGDNITPPPQALNWIIDTWGDERAIAAAGRVIVYVLHETVGHLGIFVGADIARKEHDQIVNSLDVIENLPPGLYEMKLHPKVEAAAPRREDLEPGSYGVNFEHRTLDDLRAINPEGRAEERIFSTVAQYSDILLALYKTWARPWLRPLAVRPLADLAVHWHPLRSQRMALSDANPVLQAVAAWAGPLRAQRQAATGTAAETPVDRRLEATVAGWMETALDVYRELRDQATVQTVRWLFGPFGLGAWLPPAPADEQRALARARSELEAARREALARVDEGGFPQAVCRIVFAAMVASGAFERRSLRLARLLARLPEYEGDRRQLRLDWRHVMSEAARISAVAPAEALESLARLLPDRSARERALAMASAVMLIEPTVPGPAAAMIDSLTDRLGADRGRVRDLALAMGIRATQGRVAVDA